MMKKFIGIVFLVGCAYGHYNVPDDADISQDAVNGSKCDQAFQRIKNCGVNQGLEYCSDCWETCLNNAPYASCAEIQNKQDVWWSNLNACLDMCK